MQVIYYMPPSFVFPLAFSMPRTSSVGYTGFDDLHGETSRVLLCENYEALPAKGKDELDELRSVPSPGRMCFFRLRPSAGRGIP